MRKALTCLQIRLADCIRQAERVSLTTLSTDRCSTLVTQFFAKYPPSKPLSECTITNLITKVRFSAFLQLFLT